ncbi:hypothetical protein TWF694_004276 [Orbilia ellipsospora]|uniref:Uncharacterized protein n=1 Tax=Orbilia ellipsospora TaxID=2528407 RepID=A0AAV9WXI7_9PEZI
MQLSKIHRHRHTLTPEDIIRAMNADERASLRSQSAQEGVFIREVSNIDGPRGPPSDGIHQIGTHGRQSSSTMPFPPGLQLPPFAYGTPSVNPVRRRMQSMTTPGSRRLMLPLDDNDLYGHSFAAAELAERANKPGCVPQPHNQPPRHVHLIADTPKENRKPQHLHCTPSSLRPTPTPTGILGEHRRKMGTIRGFSMTKTTDSNDQEVPAPSPTNPGSPASLAIDDSDSVDSLLRNTPIFPGDPQDVSSPTSLEMETTMAPRSSSTRLEASGLNEELLQSIPESSLQGEEAPFVIDTVFQPLELSLTNSVTEYQAEVPKLSNTSTSESLSVRATNATNIQESRSNNTLIQGAGNKKPQSRSDQPERQPPFAKQSVADSNKTKVGERVGQVKSANGFGKKNSKGKQAKNSGNSNKVTKSEMSNMNSQTKAQGSEPRDIKGPAAKNLLEDNKPISRRLNSDNSGTSRRRRGHSAGNSMTNVLPKGNIFDKLPPSLPAGPITPLKPTFNAAVLPPNPTRQLTDSSSGYRPFRTREPTTAVGFDQRSKLEVANAFPFHVSKQPMQTVSPRQYYAPLQPTLSPAGQPMQNSYSYFPSAGSSHQISQTQISQTRMPRAQMPQTQIGYNQSRQFSPFRHPGSQQLPPPPLQLHTYNQNYQGPVGRYGSGNGYNNQKPYIQPVAQGYAANFNYQPQKHQHQYLASSQSQRQYHHQNQSQQQQQPGMAYPQITQTAPPTPQRHLGYISNPSFHAGLPYNRNTGGNVKNSNAGHRGHMRSSSFQGQTQAQAQTRAQVQLRSQQDNGGAQNKPKIVQQARYQRRPPSPPPIVKISVRDGKLLWPIGPFIPINTLGCPPWEMDSTTFVNVLCTSIGVLKLPFSVPFLRLLKQVLPPKHGDHIITFPTMLADFKDIGPYWERCYYAQRFLRKYSTVLGCKPFSEIPKGDWPRVEILLGSDNTKGCNFNIYLSQPDEKRLLFRCVEQKNGQEDDTPKATFFVTVHQTGVNEVQYSDPTTCDPNVPLPPLDGSRDPRTTPEFKFNLPHYLCLNESRGITTHGFTDIGIPAKRLNFHPFSENNFDSLWYSMAHLQELVCEDDGKTIEDMKKYDHPDKIMGKKGFLKAYEVREALMKGIHGKFAEHDEILKKNCRVAASKGIVSKNSKVTGPKNPREAAPEEVSSPKAEAGRTQVACI